MANPYRESEDRAVLRTLESDYTHPLIAEARRRQDEILEGRFVGRPLRIADIGCGTGVHGSLFGPTCDSYAGFEISPETAAIARMRWESEGLGQARVWVGDAAELPLHGAPYDLVLCMYFTPGNIRDPFGDFSLYTDDYLDRNPRFIQVMSRFHQALRPGGRMLLTVYKDLPEAEAAQRDFYVNTGQHPVTPRGTRFVATREGFWSVRWTRKSMLSNLAAFGVGEGQVDFHDLNEIAWLVEVTRLPASAPAASKPTEKP
jgi:SAM-dependent methyltransferase